MTAAPARGRVVSPFAAGRVFAAVSGVGSADEREAARGLLAWLLGEVVPGAAHLPVASRESGQPYLPDRPDVAVSLSHDAGWVAAAVGLGVPVGVDVQPPQPVSDGMLRRCCTPTALSTLSSLSDVDRSLEFARIWTAQEACVKADGTGIAGLPWTVPVEVGQRTGSWRGYRWRRLDTAVPASCAYREGA